MTNKQRRAQRRERAKLNRQRAVKKAVAVNMQTVRAGEHTKAREQQERFEVDLNRKWYVIRTLPRWSGRAAEQIRAVGIPVFEAREAVRLVSDIGKVRVALIPVMRRLLFVGVNDGAELKLVESHPGVYDDATGFRRERTTGTVRGSGGGVMVITPIDLQNFADCITGHGGDDDAAKAFLFVVGQSVTITDGAFVEMGGRVEAIDEVRRRLKVAVPVFNGAAIVDLEENQVQAA